MWHMDSSAQVSQHASSKGRKVLFIVIIVAAVAAIAWVIYTQVTKMQIRKESDAQAQALTQTQENSAAAPLLTEKERSSALKQTQKSSDALPDLTEQQKAQILLDMAKQSQQ